MPYSQPACQAAILLARQQKCLPGSQNACGAIGMPPGQPERIPGSQEACREPRMPPKHPEFLPGSQEAFPAAIPLAGQPECMLGSHNACWPTQCWRRRQAAAERDFIMDKTTPSNLCAMIAPPGWGVNRLEVFELPYLVAGCCLCLFAYIAKS